VGAPDTTIIQVTMEVPQRVLRELVYH
jgi:hypothetical protein